jgi:hypothetical protein
MTNKIKFFDSICFSGELELLKFRLTELSPYVEHFIITENDNLNSKFLNNRELFKEWEHKITHIFTTEENYSDKIKDEFIKLNPAFEDVLMISQTNEIPNLIYIDDFFEKLKFNPFIIEHKNFQWNIDYVTNELSIGTLVFSLSFILQNKNVIKTYLKTKKNINIRKSFLLKNGWKFSNFGNYETKIEELLPPTQIDPVRTYPLIKHNNEIELPKNLDLLPYVKIGRDEVKKHLFLVESDLEFVNQDYYDTVTIINFDSNLKEVLCEKVSDKITKSVLFLPNMVLYGEPETFHDEYMMNETKRMFSVVFPQEQDIIEIIFKNKKPLVLGGVSN